jgi:heptosyltransferase II
MNTESRVPARTSRDRLDRGRVRDILIVLRNNQLGDMLCSQPLYKALKRGFTDAAITILAAPTNYAIPFHAINPFIDHVEHYDRSLLRSVLLMPRLRRVRSFQIGIVPSTVKVSFSLHVLNRLAGPRVRVGVHSLDGRPNPGRFLLNKSGDFEWNARAIHQRDRNRDIARLLDCDISDEELFENSIGVEPADLVAISQRLAKEGILESECIIGIHPGAGAKSRMWPVDHFAALSARLQELVPARFVMTPGPVDADLVPLVEHAFESRGVPIHVMHGMTFGETTSLMRRMRLYVTNDTGTMHVAAALGIETVCMALPNVGDVWIPRLPNVHACFSAAADIGTITPDEVFLACRRVISRIDP